MHAWVGTATRSVRGDGAETDDDLRLARLAALGDRDAFDAIARRHGPRMLRHAQRLLLDTGDAEEATQDALLAAWRSVDRFRGQSSLSTWLFTITSHKARDLGRRRRPVPVSDATLTRSVDATARRAGTTETLPDLAEQLEQELRRLPARQRESWLLVDLEGMTTAEAAELQGTSRDVVRGNLARARHTLRSRLGEARADRTRR